MPDTVIESVLKGKLESDLLIKWLTNEATEDLPEDCILCCCSRSEFAAFFLSYLRNQTDSILQTNSNALQILQQNTPEKLFTSNRKHRRSISDPTSETHHMDSLSVKSDHQKSQESPNREKKKGKKVKTKLFSDNSVSSDDSRLSSGVDRLLISSTPIKNGLKTDYPTCLTSPVTPTRHFKEQERCDTPRLNHRYSRSSDKSVSLGDYLATAQKSSKKKKKNSSNDDSKILNLSNSDCKTLDSSNADSIWNTEFPEIGARKSNSLKSEKRRIKPTSIEKQKSFSLNSFNAECFQQSSPGVEENSAFKHQKIQPKPHETNSFEAERNILKQERHKLMEKFNILNTATTPKAVTTPQIKIMKRDSVEKPQSYVEADVSKVSCKEKLDSLIEIYEVLLKNNLVLSFTTEIYFLISILLSKQVEDDFLNVEQKLISQENIPNFLLKSIHNSSYFAVKSLWNQRSVLELILDKNALKILGENRKVRSFFPDLAKFLLNSYGLKCEAESVEKCKSTLENRCNGIVCFNMETDNAENFPTLLSFQSFKKQRDMFYEILRWYGTTHQTSGFSRSTFRGRIKTLICTGSSADNHKHLATLFLSQMKVDCLTVGTQQESKLSKLQRRLTTPTVADTHRLPTFTEKETFYKEFIMYTDNEAFRTHLRDAIASEMVEQDAKPICNNDDRSHNSNTLDLQKEFLQVSRKLRLLSKFLGLLASLPYSQVPIEVTLKMGSSRDTQRENIYATPKEKVLETNIALRKYIQPCIDLKRIFRNATESGRLCVTVPWIVHYLSMLDYTSLRIDYTQHIIGHLFHVYVNRLRASEDRRIRRTTAVYLKIVLGWLFSLPHFPQELFQDGCPPEYCDSVSVSSDSVVIDNCDLIDERVLFELCPFLKDINVLLSVCCVIGDKETTFRHITPVSLNVNTEDRIKNKKKELQARLEEEFLKSQPSSTRRVLEVVIERVTSGCVRELSVHSLHEARRSAREQAAKIVRNGNDDQAALLKTLEALYNDQLMQLRENALSNATNTIKKRTASALSALLPSAPKPLQAVAAKGCVNRLTKWLNDNWNSTAILCKNLEEELSSLISLEMRLNSEPLTVQNAPTAVVNAETLVSAAESIVRLKEAVCQLLDYEEPSDLATILNNCAISCSPGNVFTRPPTKRAILQLSVDLAIVYVSRRPKEVNDRFLQRLDSVWNVCCPDRKSTRSTSSGQSPEPILERPRTPKTPDRDESSSIEATEESELLVFFDRILCSRNIVLLNDSKCGHGDVWNSVATVLVFCLRNNYLSEDSLTEQCLAVYRQDWPQGILENLSQCMKSVSTRWSTSSAGKFNLFLDFLAEYCGDMDYEPMLD